MQQIENLIANEQRTIDDAQSVVNQLDSAVQSLLQYDRIRGQDGAIAVRQSQKQERQDLSSVISDANVRMVELQNEYSALKTTQLKMEAEIGPLKYVAELIYGEDAKAHFDQAVRMIIFVIVIVFDPLAICLIIAGNVGISKRNVLITQKGDYLEVSTNSILNVD
jgi:cell division protein FtsB